VVEFYSPGTSWLHLTDARVKLIFTLASIPVLLLLQNVLLMAAALAWVLLLYFSAGLPANRITRLMKAIAPVSLIMMVLRTVFYPAGAELAAWGPVRLTTVGIADGLTLGLRLICMALVVFLWLYTTESHAIVRSLVKLGIPYAWGLSLSLALRFIPSVSASYQTILQAQRSRGLDLEALRGIRRVRAMLPGMLALMVTSFRASESMARALEARAFGAQAVQRTTLLELRFRALDRVYLIVITLGFGLLLYLRIRFGFGSDPLALLAG
jgi:energy-coupling factor transport system permease protein